MTARQCAVGYLAATALAFAYVAFHTPPQGEDWLHLVWGAKNPASRFLIDHYTATDIIGYALAHSTALHTIATPLFATALVIGATTLALRRRVDLASWDDVGLIIVCGGLLWLATARLGVAWFHRPGAAASIYGLAFAVWAIAPLYCNWRLAWRGYALVMAVVGFVAASAARPVAIVLVIYAALAIQRSRQRTGWMVGLLIGLVGGALAVFLDRPGMDLAGFSEQIEGAINIGRETAEIISLVLVLTMARLVIVELRPRFAADCAPPDTSRALWWLLVWFVVGIVAIISPRFTEAGFAPPALVMTIAALPIFPWLMAVRPLRVLVLAIVVVAQLIGWTLSIARYRELADEYAGWLTAIDNTPVGGIVKLAPPRHVDADFFSFGGDWAEPAARQNAARWLFDRGDIVFTAAFKGFEASPELAIVLETADREALARAPARWPSVASAARADFDDFIDTLPEPDRFDGRLRVTNLTFAALAGRPVYVATSERGELAWHRVRRKRINDDYQITLEVRPDDLAAPFPETHLWVGDREVAEVIRDGGSFRVPLRSTARYVLVACDAARCFLVDAFRRQL